MRNLKVNNIVVENVKVNGTQVQVVNCNGTKVWENWVKTSNDVYANYTAPQLNMYSGNLGNTKLKRNMTVSINKHFNYTGVVSRAIYLEGSLDNVNWYQVASPITFDTPSGVGNSLSRTVQTTTNVEFIYFRARLNKEGNASTTNATRMYNWEQAGL